jgi:tRNA threonylcarbamoyladenosine modification (KEOPS) complex Cgi121 subunit
MADETLRIFVKAYTCGRESSPEAMKREVLSANPGAVVQAARGGVATNELFVEMLAAQTLRAESSGTLLAKRPEIDLLLRLAGTDQISTAIREKGARAGEPFLVFSAGRSPQKRVKVLSGRELPRRKLSVAELQMVEKAALLEVRRP